MPKKSVQKRVKLALFVLVGVAVLILAGQVVRLINNFHEPITFGMPQRNIHWERNYPLNLILHVGTFAILSFDPDQDKVALVNIPESLVSDSSLDVSGLEESLESNLGVPIDGYIQLTTNFSKTTPFEIVQKLKQNPVNWFLNLKAIKSDLTPKELLNLSLSLPRVRIDKINEFSLGVDADSTTSKYLSDARLKNDQATVAVFNATDTPGLAQKAARVISNLGGNVIIISSLKSKNLQKSLVLVKDNAPSYSSERLKEIFSPECINSYKCDILEDTDITNSRAQINIVLGQDFVGKY